LICAENQKLNVENPLLKQQIISLEELNNLYVKSDSIQRIEIEMYKQEIISNEEKIEKLKSTQKISIIGGILLFILGLII